MGPRLFCGLASCAGLLFIAPVQARDAALDGKPGARKGDAETPADFVARHRQSFRDGVAAIIAEPSVGGPRIWSDIDRNRLPDGFRLSTGPHAAQPKTGPLVMTPAAMVLVRGTTPAAAPRPIARSLVDTFTTGVTISADGSQHRTLTLGLDSGPPAGPVDDEMSYTARTTVHDMSPAGACMGRMPAFACGADDSGSTNDSMVAVALAYNF